MWSLCLPFFFSYKCIRRSLEDSNRCPKCNYIIDNVDQLYPNFLGECMMDQLVLAFYLFIFPFKSSTLSYSLMFTQSSQKFPMIAKVHMDSTNVSAQKYISIASSLFLPCEWCERRLVIRWRSSLLEVVWDTCPYYICSMNGNVSQTASKDQLVSSVQLFSHDVADVYNGLIFFFSSFFKMCSVVLMFFRHYRYICISNKNIYENAPSYYDCY